MFVEHDGADVRFVNDHVDDHEIGLGIVSRHLTQCVTKGKAGHHDGVGAGFGEAAERLLPLGFGLKLDFAEFAACFFSPTLRAAERRFVERLVELAAQIEDQGRFGHRGTGAEGQCGTRAEDFRHEGHMVSPLVIILGRGAATAHRSRCRMIRGKLGRSRASGSTAFLAEAARFSPVQRPIPCGSACPVRGA